MAMGVAVFASLKMVSNALMEANMIKMCAKKHVEMARIWVLWNVMTEIPRMEMAVIQIAQSKLAILVQEETIPKIIVLKYVEMEEILELMNAMMAI